MSAHRRRAAPLKTFGRFLHVWATAAAATHRSRRSDCFFATPPRPRPTPSVAASCDPPPSVAAGCDLPPSGAAAVFPGYDVRVDPSDFVVPLSCVLDDFLLFETALLVEGDFSVGTVACAASDGADLR